MSTNMASTRNKTVGRTSEAQSANPNTPKWQATPPVNPPDTLMIGGRAALNLDRTACRVYGSGVGVSQAPGASKDGSPSKPCS
jgi:hypothetical protein